MFITAWFTMVRETLSDEKDLRWGDEGALALVPDFGNLINISVSGVPGRLPKSPMGEADPQPR